MSSSLPAPRPDENTPAKPKRRRRISRRWAALIYIAFLLLLCETGARLYWSITARVPFLRPRDIYYTFYPELRDSGVESATVRRDDGTFDVLLLGASVLFHEYGDIETKLKAELEQRYQKPVRVFNVSNIGRTSLDSLKRYERLSDKQFDLVVVYHGINDSRMNNCPRAVFRDDYSHCDWYDRLARLERHPEVAYFALPFALENWWIDLKVRTGSSDYIPRLRPRKKWKDEAIDIKTERTFRANLLSIVELAKGRGDPVMLMTFAHHLPANYSEESFAAGQLDYATHATPIRIWGEPAAVLKAIQTHNRVIRDIAASNPEVLFVDQESLIQDGGRNFNDVCHLTPQGCASWVENVASRAIVSQVAHRQREAASVR